MGQAYRPLPASANYTMAATSVTPQHAVTPLWLSNAFAEIQSNQGRVALIHARTYYTRGARDGELREKGEGGEQLARIDLDG